MPERNKKFIPWSKADIDALRKHYPKGGSQAVIPHLETLRSGRSIQERARIMKVRCETHGKYIQHENSEFIDAAIRRAVQSGERGALKDIARIHGLAYRRIKNRVMELGLSMERKWRPWTPEEDALLDTMAGKAVQTIYRKFRERGFTRSESAIYNRLFVLKLDTSDPDYHSASDLARLLGTDPHVIINWINKGWLKAERGRIKVGDTQPRNFRIGRSDIRSFIRNYPAYINVARVEKHWFIELLAGPPRRVQADSEKCQAGEGV